MNLLDIFSGGSRQGKEFTDKEFNSVAALYNGDIVRDNFCSISVAEMNEILQKYIEMPLDQTNLCSLDYLAYLEEYDTYYMKHRDTNMCQVKLLKGYRSADSSVTILHERQCMYAWFSELGVLALRQAPTALGYYFVSNVPYDTDFT